MGHLDFSSLMDKEENKRGILHRPLQSGTKQTSSVIPSYSVPHGNWHYVTKKKKIKQLVHANSFHSEDDRKIENV